MRLSAFLVFSLLPIWKRRFENFGGWSNLAANWQSRPGDHTFLSRSIRSGEKQCELSDQIYIPLSIRGTASTRRNSFGSFCKAVAYQMWRSRQSRRVRFYSQLKTGGPLYSVRGYGARLT